MEQFWPQLPAPQQPVRLDSIGELCASLRRDMIPVLRTGTPEARTSSAGPNHAQRHAAVPHAVEDEAVCQPGPPPSPLGTTAEPVGCCSACAAVSAAEKVQPFTGPTLTSPAGPQLYVPSKLQPLDSSPAAGESAGTAVPGPRSSCSSEAAIMSPRSPGDRTDSDDEGARRCRSPPHAAAPAVPASSAAVEDNAAASAGESEAERQPGAADHPCSDVGAALGAENAGDVVADLGQPYSGAQQVWSDPVGLGKALLLAVTRGRCQQKRIALTALRRRGTKNYVDQELC